MLFADIEWAMLIVPFIALVVWLVSLLARNPEPPQKNIRRAGSRAQEEPKRQTSSDLDRFIMETRRQREADERRAQRPPQVSTQRQRRPVMLEEVVEQPPRPAPRPPVLQPVAPRPIVRTPTRPVPVLELAESVPSAPVMATLAQTALPQIPAQPSAPVDLLKRDEAKVSPLLSNLRATLNTPQSAQLAFALGEIFGEPLSRRRRS
jgi:hypothetical protein